MRPAPGDSMAPIGGRQGKQHRTGRIIVNRKSPPPGAARRPVRCPERPCQGSSAISCMPCRSSCGMLPHNLLSS